MHASHVVGWNNISSHTSKFDWSTSLKYEKNPSFGGDIFRMIVNREKQVKEGLDFVSL